MAATRVRHTDMQRCAAQRTAQEEQPPKPREEERPEERGERSSGPRQDSGAGKMRKERRVANWSEMMQRQTLDKGASAE